MGQAMGRGPEIIGTAERIERSDGSVRNTLLIGVGGSGKEVLMRLRRLHYERRMTSGLPIMQYLWFDTDTGRQNINKEDYDRIDEKLYFDALEQIRGSIQPEELSHYYSNAGLFPHIFGWFNREVFQPLGNSVVVKGAGQIRALGRLAFFHKYRELREAISRKVGSFGGRITDETRAAGFDKIDPDTEVIIILSLAGGTGAGCFIDMAFLVKEIAPNAMITGILFLPEVFERNSAIDQNVVMANGYAAMKELEYYLDADNSDTPDGRFTFYWDNSPHMVPGPPFSTVYLLGNRNELGRITDDYTDVFQMAAEFLMLDFDGSQFSADKRSRRSNMEQYFHTRTQYPVYDDRSGDTSIPVYVDHFPNKYSSFGISQIQLNQPRVANAAAYKLAESMIKFWRKEGDVVRGFEYEDVRNTLSQLGVTIDDLVEALLVDLPVEAYNLEIDNRFQPILDKLDNRLKEFGAPAGDGEGRLVFGVDELAPFCDGVNGQVENTINAILRGVDDNLRQRGTAKGDHLKMLDRNARMLQENLAENFQHEMLELLSNPSRFGVNYARVFLERSREVIQRIIREIDEKRGDISESLDKEVNFEVKGREEYNRCRALRQEAQNLPFYALWMKSAAINHFDGKLADARDSFLRGNINRLRQATLEKKEQLKSFLRDRYCGEAYQRLIEPRTGILRQLVTQIGSRTEAKNVDGSVSIKVTGLLRLLSYFMENLGEFQNYFREMFEAYENPPRSMRNLNLSRDISYLEETIGYLEQQYAIAGRDEVMDRASGDFFIDSGLVAHDVAEDETKNVEDLIVSGIKAIYALSAQKDENMRPWLQVRDSLESFALRRMRDFRKDQSVLGHLRRTYPDEDSLRNALRDRVEFGCVRLEKSALPFPYESIQYNAILGLNPTDDTISNDIRDAASGRNPFADSQPLLYNLDSLIFYTELVAYPTYYARALANMRNEYINNLKVDLDRHVYYRHSDGNYRKFEDILPPENTDEAYKRIANHKLLMESLLVNTVEYSPQNDFVVLERERGMTRRTPIGNTIQEAITFLSFNERYAAHLRQANGDVRERWETYSDTEQDKWFQLLRIIQYIAEEVFPMRRKIVLPELKQTENITDMDSVIFARLYREKWDYVKGLDSSLTDDEIRGKMEGQGDLDNFSIEINYKYHREQDTRPKIRVMKDAGIQR